MYTYETKVRVKYGETDKMGYCYYGNYPLYYEMGRTELMRCLGYSYRQLEEEGIMMPVLSMNISYYKPAFYDDELTIKTIIREMPVSRIRFEYEISNVEGQLLNKGETVLAFVDMKKNRPVRAPKNITDRLIPYIKD